MPTVQIYHNPRCSKSRQTLQLLIDNGHSPEIVEYLKNPPSVEQLKEIISMLGFSDVRQLMRVKEPEYKEQHLEQSGLSAEALINAMVNTPKLIERPIVIANNKAKIGRPPEDVLSLF